MTKRTWWLRLVGGFYLLLALTSLRVLFVDPQMFGAMNPFAADEQALRAFADAWLIFVLEMGVLGAIMLYYARDSAYNRILVLTVSILELIRGAGGDLLWMSRGWPAANYVPFMILHLIIAGTGLYFLKQEAIQK
jgi:CHASE2 domain-containing sensor protein